MRIGVAELDDYEWFFGGFPRRTEADAAGALGVNPGQEVVVYPRRAFDLWNTRYFVVPYYPSRWDDENRGFASFLEQTERIFPSPHAFDGPDREAKEREWARNHDFQVLRSQSF